MKHIYNTPISLSSYLSTIWPCELPVYCAHAYHQGPLALQRNTATTPLNTIHPFISRALFLLWHLMSSFGMLCLVCFACIAVIYALFLRPRFLVPGSSVFPFYRQAAPLLLQSWHPQQSVTPCMYRGLEPGSTCFGSAILNDLVVDTESQTFQKCNWTFLIFNIKVVYITIFGTLCRVTVNMTASV